MRVRLRLCIVLLCVINTVSSYARRRHGDETDPIVRTAAGFIRGKRQFLMNGEHVVESYLGIPFGEPPIGELRFANPVEKAPWDGVLDTVRFGPDCHQILDTAFPGFTGAEMWNPDGPFDEDCLYLNVWKPVRNYGRPLHVMVWIFGGGYYYGSASLDIYNGGKLAALGDVIIVAMNYRVGAMGFLATGDGRSNGNFGMMDQVLAMKWTRENIEFFGGNPNSITIFGESAGAASVGFHLLSPVSHPYYDRAILQSGAPTSMWATMSRDQAALRTRRLANVTNCPNDEGLLSCLRATPPEVYPVRDWVTASFDEFPWVVYADGVFLPDDPEILLRAEKFKQTDILLGANKDEGNFFLVYGVPGFLIDRPSFISHTQFNYAVEQVNYDLGDCEKHAVKYRYTYWPDVYSPVANRDAMDDVVGDRGFLCPIVELANDYISADNTVYMYHFIHRTSTEVWPDWMGVIHGAEIQFLFGWPLDDFRNYTDGERQLSTDMIAYFTNFAKTGNPNDQDLVEWPKLSENGKEYLELSRYPRQKSGLRAEYCAFWSVYIPQLQNSIDGRCQWQKKRRRAESRRRVYGLDTRRYG